MSRYNISGIQNLTGQGTEDSSIQSKSQCEKLNAYWSDKDSKCYRCSTSSEFPDRDTLRCLPCEGNVCGSGHGYCSNNTSSCTIDPETEQYSNNCKCNWFQTFAGWTCQMSEDGSKCLYDTSKWYMSILFIIVGAIIILLFIYLMYMIFG